MKKKFLTPTVVQQVEICLEKDLLARSSDDMTVTNDGQYFEDHDYSGDQEWGVE